MSLWLRALSIKQPWCDAIVDGHKPIENRSAGFPWRYRGTIALHASRQWSERGATDARVQAAYPSFDREWVTGAIIGLGDLVDVHDDNGCCRPWGESVYEESDGRRRTLLKHIVIERARRLSDPVAVRGNLGLWHLPSDIEALVMHLDPQRKGAR